MRRLTALALLLPSVLAAALTTRGLAAEEQAPEPLTSTILKTDAGEQVLVQVVLVEAGIDAAWAAYATSDGYTAWAAPVAEIDLKVAGTYRTHYTPGATPGDAGTNTLRIVNYVPQRLLTLRAEPAPTWPAFLREDAGRLSNVILFEALGATRTRITSYGIGYRDTPQYAGVLGFFARANLELLGHLRTYLEKGTRRDWGG